MMYDIIVMLLKCLSLHKVEFWIKNEIGSWDMIQMLKILDAQSWGPVIRYKHSCNGLKNITMPVTVAVKDPTTSSVLHVLIGVHSCTYTCTCTHSDTYTDK